MLPVILLTNLLLALLVVANPVVANRPPASLKLTRRVNVTSVHNLLRHDQARARALKLRASGHASRADKRAVISESVDNQAVTYVATVAVGKPSTDYSLLIDTGSSNTWLGADKSYVATDTSTSTPDSVAVTYGSGSFSGHEYLDQVSLAPGLVIVNQSIGVASTSSGFDGVDGILGIGPNGLTVGTLVNKPSATIPTVTDNLFKAGTITENRIGISFEPTTSLEALNGELTWGGTDKSKYTGSISYSSTSTSPANQYWGISQSISYGSSAASTPILTTTAGIVDTGTTLVLIASNAFELYKAATGAVEDSATGLLRLTPAQYGLLKSLFFKVNGITYEFTANAQIWPRALNTALGGSSDFVYLIVGDIGANSGEGLDFINGYSFLERFYSVYDTTTRKVGLATTPYTNATTN